MKKHIFAHLLPQIVDRFFLQLAGDPYHIGKRDIVRMPWLAYLLKVAFQSGVLYIISGCKGLLQVEISVFPLFEGPWRCFFDSLLLQSRCYLTSFTITAAFVLCCSVYAVGVELIRE